MSKPNTLRICFWLLTQAQLVFLDGGASFLLCAMCTGMTVESKVNVIFHIYVYCIGRRQYQRYLNIFLGGVVEVVNSNLARNEIFTASICSVDSLYLSVRLFGFNCHFLLIF